MAHNPAGAWALRSTLSSLYEDRKIIFVFGAMRDKAIREITEILFPLGERVIAFVQTKAGTRITQEELQALCSANLARYRIPEEVVFVDSFQRNSMGKIVRKGLR